MMLYFSRGPAFLGWILQIVTIVSALHSHNINIFRVMSAERKETSTQFFTDTPLSQPKKVWNIATAPAGNFIKNEHSSIPRSNGRFIHPQVRAPLY